MIRELESVVLTTDLPEYGLERDDIGTVVLALDGQTVAVVSVLAAQVRPVARREIAHARVVLALSQA